MTPYKIGDRVVCPYPDARPFVGEVTHVHNCGDLTVSDGVAHVRASVEEVRPVMPRSPADLAAFGAFWWRGEEAVEIDAGPRGLRLWRPGREVAEHVYPSEGWRGPVAPPPEVRP